MPTEPFFRRRTFAGLPAFSPILHQVFTFMETLLVKIFATALALSQVTTAPEAITHPV